MTQRLFQIPWLDVLLPKPSWAEKSLRPIIIYLTLLVIFRVSSKRGLAQATLFDFLILLLISNVVQNAIIGDDNSILGATVGALALVLISSLFNRVTARNRRVRRLLEGQPVLLVQDGRVDEAMMTRQNVSRNDLLSAIRKQGIVRLQDVGFAVLELDGTISVIRADDDKRPHDCLPIEIAGRESAESADDPCEDLPHPQHQHVDIET